MDETGVATGEPLRYPRRVLGGSLNRHQAIARILTLTGIAWFVLWACAPMMSAPPSPPMPTDTHYEMGGGFNVTPPVLNSHFTEYLVNGQFWYRNLVNADTQEERGVLFQAGWPSIISGGAYFRKGLPGSNERTRISYQVEGGVLWFGYSMPFATRLGEKTWFTTQPSVRFSFLSVFHVPVGLSWELGKNLRLDTEVGGHASMINYKGEFKPNRGMIYGAMGLSHHY